MRKSLLITVIALFFISTSAYSQLFTLGPKAGISSSTTRLSESAAEIESGDAQLSYHAGLFARVSILGFYVQPELYFNSVSGEYIDTSNPQDQTFEFNQNRLDVPILIGYKLGPLRINAGPVAQIDLGNETDTNNLVSKYKSGIVAFQAGVGVDISKLTLDLRYEGTFGGQATLNNNADNEVKINQLMLSVGFKLL